MVWQNVVLIAVLGSLVARSHQWFESCDRALSLQIGYPQTITSDGYPSKGFPLYSSCRWVISAPGEYQVQAVCYIELTGPSPACQEQRFFVGTSGSADPNQATYYCSTQTISAISDGNQLMLGYLATNNTGRFSCQLTPTCSCGRTMTSRIVGGTNAGPTEFTPMASIFNTVSKVHFCGATIIGSAWAMTAAHCMTTKTTSPLQVAAGIYRTDQANAYNQYMGISRTVLHPNYRAGADTYDVALVQVIGRFRWSELVAPACLPFFYPSYDFAGRYVQATGWGMDGLGGKLMAILQKVDLQVLSNAECNSRLTSAQVGDSQMCTYLGGRDTCQQDSGGPIWYRGGGDQRLFILGVVSYGEGCGGSTPGVNTRVTLFLPWIEMVLGGPMCKLPIT